MTAESTEMTVDNGGVGIHVTADGDPAAPPVVVLHGITSCTRTWDWLVPHLAPTHRVLRVDFRGHGLSDRTPGDYMFPHYLTDAVAVCEQVAGAPAIVVGHSLGGGTAAALAQQRPDLVAGIVLEDPALASRSEMPPSNSLFDVFALMRQALPMLQEAGTPVADLVQMLAAGPTSRGAVMGEVMHADALEAMAIGMLQLDATVLDPVLDATMVTAFDPHAPIPVRGLVLTADPAMPDCVCRPADTALLAQHSPQVEVRVVAGAGHLIHDALADRQTLLDAILAFCA